MKPIYAFRSEREIEKDLRTLKRRLRDRMIAGRMAIAYLQKARGITPKLPGPRARLSINTMSELVAEDAGYTDPANVKTRIWRPSLPVIHLAAAVQVLQQAAPEPLNIGNLMLDRSLIEWVIREAEEYEHLLTEAHYRGIDAGQLTKLRMASDC